MQNMESVSLTVGRQPDIIQRLLSAAIPVTLIAVSYVDPGKWAAAVEGGTHFGLDLVFLMLVFSFAAILCQYLSARIALVTDRNLAQICRDEYDRVTCILLGVQAELSVIALDLTMVLGTAYGLTVVFGTNLLTSVFLSAIDALLFPLLAKHLDYGKSKLLCIRLASFILLSYVIGVLISQPESPISVGVLLTKLNGDSAFALMGLLGANIMPHNFYLHSSIVQDQETTNVPKGTLCHDHFFAILCVYSGIFLVNYVHMSSAANLFYSAGPFEDAMSLLDQVFRSSVAPSLLILLTFASNQIMAFTWNAGRQVVLSDLFRTELAGFLHRLTIRMIAIIPILYCVWHSGPEGVYQMLLFTQVVVAIMLPSSVVPLFRVASSRSIMGASKIPQFLELSAIATFFGMLALKILFVIELIFGTSDWASNLRWNMGSVPTAYVVLLSAASASFILMLWLATTPLKSASSRLDVQLLDLDMQVKALGPSSEVGQNDTRGVYYRAEKPDQSHDPSLPSEKSMVSHQEKSIPNFIPTPNLNLPETLLDSVSEIHLTTIEENNAETTFSGPACHPGVSEASRESAISTISGRDDSNSQSPDTNVLNTGSTDVVEKTVRIEGDILNEKDDEVDPWEPEEPSKVVSGNSQSLTPEGPPSFRSLSGKNDDAGSGTGSLSRLAGLGRAARRQLTAILDEFWGQLFDFHGQATQEAKAKKLDILLGIDSKVDPKPPSTSLKLESNRKEFAGFYPSVGKLATDSHVNSTLYNPTMQLVGQRGMESSYGVQSGPSSMWSSHMQLLDAFVQSSTRNNLDGERRYSSMRIPASTDSFDQQPATVHGYELASYISRVGRERGSMLDCQTESLEPKSTSSIRSSFGDSFARPMGQKPQNGGLSTRTPPGFHNVSIPRTNTLQPNRPTYDLSSPGPAKSTTSAVNAKKFCSLPDISGLYVPERDSPSHGRSDLLNNSLEYGNAVARSIYDRPFSSVYSRTGAPLAFDELSPSKVCRDAFSLQFGSSSGTESLWTKQPDEQFGLADKPRGTESGRPRSMMSSYTHETNVVVDLEAKLLQSFRYCILKLLKLEGSDWLFRQNDGADEDLIDRVAAREKFLYEAETREMNWPVNTADSQFSSDRKQGSGLRSDDTDYMKLLVMSVPHCGDGCIWKVDLILSFGVWCIHRVLELSLMESRPELWGKYTYVLNRLQGIVDLAFSKPRSPMMPCFCLQVPTGQQQRSSPPISNGSLPPPAKLGRGKCTTAAMLLDIIKDVEIAISCRKGRTGTAAGDVAFPKGKENLASVLKRYKRRLSNKPIGSQDGGSGLRKAHH